MSGKSSVTAQDIALVQMQGGVVGATVEYMGFSNRTNAIRAAQRDLRALSTPLVSCTIYTGRDAADLSIGDVFKLEWPDYGDEVLIMRITGMAFADGKSDRIKIDCVQDVFGTPETLMLDSDRGGLWNNPTRPPAPVDGGDGPVLPPDADDPPPGSSDSGYSDFIEEPPAVGPEIIGQALTLETPYYPIARRLGDTDAQAIFTADEYAGFFSVAAARPARAINARIWVDRGEGLVSVGTLDFAPFGVAVSPLTQRRSVFQSGDRFLSATDRQLIIGSVVDPTRWRVGAFGQIGTEIIVIDQLLDIGSGQYVLSVNRGALDTVQQDHAIGEPLLIWQDWGGTDSVQYVSGELISVSLQSQNNSGPGPISTPQFVRFNHRAIRPYPPGRVRINGQEYPENLGGELLTITWAHRDRLQQTSSFVVHEGFGSIGPEAGTTYTLQITDTVGNVLIQETGLTGTSWEEDSSAIIEDAEFVIRLWSVRDGFASWQAHSITVARGTPVVSSESEIVGECWSWEGTTEYTRPDADAVEFSWVGSEEYTRDCP